MKETLFTKPITLKSQSFQLVPLAPPDGQNATPSVCATATMAESSEIVLQIIPLKVIGDNGRSITTYGPIDSGFDVTMIDPSLDEQFEIQGEASQLFLSTVNQREKKGTRCESKF